MIEGKFVSWASPSSWLFVQENFQTKLYGDGGQEEHGSPVWTEKADYSS